MWINTLGGHRIGRRINPPQSRSWLCPKDSNLWNLGRRRVFLFIFYHRLEYPSKINSGSKLIDCASRLFLSNQHIGLTRFWEVGTCWCWSWSYCLPLLKQNPVATPAEICVRERGFEPKHRRLRQSARSIPNGEIGNAHNSRPWIPSCNLQNEIKHFPFCNMHSANFPSTFSRHCKAGWRLFRLWCNPRFRFLLKKYQNWNFPLNACRYPSGKRGKVDGSVDWKVDCITPICCVWWCMVLDISACALLSTIVRRDSSKFSVLWFIGRAFYPSFTQYRLHSLHSDHDQESSFQRCGGHSITMRSRCFKFISSHSSKIDKKTSDLWAVYTRIDPGGEKKPISHRYCLK